MATKDKIESDIETVSGLEWKSVKMSVTKRQRVNSNGVKSVIIDLEQLHRRYIIWTVTNHLITLLSFVKTTIYNEIPA